MTLLRQPRLFVVSSPSGGGKTTLVRRLLSQLPGLAYSVSCTTRPMRPREINGKDYTFLNREAFESKIRQGEFLEYAEVHGCFYGTDRTFIEKTLLQGLDILLDLDVQGAAKVRVIRPDAVLLFVTPPNLRVLEERLRARKTEAEPVLQLRLRNAAMELTHIPEYDYLVINDNLDQATQEMAAIITAERNRVTFFSSDALAALREE